MTTHKLPFHADHIGSLLRPAELRDARAAFDQGRLAATELHAMEDRCIREAVRLQEGIGLKSITDGEYRRTVYFGHFPDAVSGFTDVESELTFHDQHGREMKYRAPIITGRLKR